MLGIKKEPKGCSDFIKGSDGKTIKISTYEAAKKLCSEKIIVLEFMIGNVMGYGYNLCKSTKEKTSWKYPSCWYEKTGRIF